MTRPMATTNSGSEVTASAPTAVTWSNQPPLRSAATIPGATPSSAPSTPLTSISTAELTSRGAT